MSAQAQPRRVKVVHLRTLAVMAANKALGVLDALSSVNGQTVAMCDLERPTCYSFLLRGTPCSATLRPTEDGFHLRLVAQLGVVPYTAENSYARTTLQDLLAFGTEVQGTRVVVTRKRRLCMSRDIELVEAPTPESVLHETVIFMQHVRPYLGLFKPYLH